MFNPGASPQTGFYLVLVAPAYGDTLTVCQPTFSLPNGPAKLEHRVARHPAGPTAPDARDTVGLHCRNAIVMELSRLFEQPCGVSACHGGHPMVNATSPALQDNSLRGHGCPLLQFRNALGHDGPDSSVTLLCKALGCECHVLTHRAAQRAQVSDLPNPQVFRLQQ